MMILDIMVIQFSNMISTSIDISNYTYKTVAVA